MTRVASVLVQDTFSHSLSLPPPRPPNLHILVFARHYDFHWPVWTLSLPTFISRSHQPFLSSANHFPLHCFSTTFSFTTARGSHEDGNYILQKHSHSTGSTFVTLLSQCAQSGRWSPFGKRVWFTESHIVSVISFYFLFYFLNLLLIKLKKKKSCCIKLTVWRLTNPIVVAPHH